MRVKKQYVIVTILILQFGFTLAQSETILI